MTWRRNPRRCEEIELAQALARQVFLLRDASALAPAAAALLLARIDEIRAERSRLDPPLAFCDICGAEWDGRSAPPGETHVACRHGEMREIWREMQEEKIHRHPDETLDRFLERWDQLPR
jgi:hypothetical protein